MRVTVGFAGFCCTTKALLFHLPRSFIMGIVSFFKEAGQKLFGNKPEVAAAVAEPSNEEKAAAANEAASSAIKEYIRSNDLPADNLSITFSGADQIVTVSGLVSTQAEREKIIACCGNVHGVAGVSDEMTCDEPDAPACQFHMVVSGDNLSKIAKQHYGDANKYPMIFEANKPMLSHPDKIYPGQNLIIPALA
jgi:nucleoid-associated protein YgaU